MTKGKGYPDIATRLLLRSIATPTKQNNFRRPPVYTLMDYDPDGMDILKTYKHGSAALAHESAELALPSVQWIGLSSNDLGQQEDLHQSQGLLKLSGRDRRKATRMLEREPFIEKEPEWRRELQAMLFLNMKAEIQLLEAQEGRIAGWLASKRLV
jgi:meiotic recombination protein SPO11